MKVCVRFNNDDHWFDDDEAACDWLENHEKLVIDRDEEIDDVRSIKKDIIHYDADELRHVDGDYDFAHPSSYVPDPRGV